VERELDSAKFRVSYPRRHHGLTVRWTPEYLVGRILLLLLQAGASLDKQELTSALALLESPKTLYRRVCALGLDAPEEVFPKRLLDSLSLQVPIVTSSHLVAVALAVAKGLIVVEVEKKNVIFRIAEPGIKIARRLAEGARGDVARASLSVSIVRSR
jgi:hypothetical protein